MSSSKNILAEVRTLELVSKYIWPAFRLLAGKNLARRCSNCFASENCSPLENGICVDCRGAGSADSVAEDTVDHDLESGKLERILREHQGVGTQQYDALLLFSGGKDSTYLLHTLRIRYPDLRLLAFTVDNNFMSPLAMDNIKEVIEKLPIDHITFKPPFSFSQKMFRYAFTHLNSGGCAGTVDQFDGDSIFDMARNFAAMNHIPLVIAGISPIQVEKNIGISTFESPRERETAKRRQVAGLELSDIFSEEEMKYWWDGSRWSGDRVPRLLFPFYAWGYDESEIRNEVTRLKLLPSGKNNPLLTNNQLIPLMALVDNARFGFSSFEPEFSQLVREGKARKENWRNLFEMAEYSAKTGRFIKKSLDDILKQLELTRSEVGLEPA